MGLRKYLKNSVVIINIPGYFHGNLNDWKHALKKAEGLFEKHPPAVRMIGPTISSMDLHITGAQGTTEASDFSQVATKEQWEFYNKLIQYGHEDLSIEYMFNVTGADDIWKKDIKVIKAWIKELRKEEHKLKEDESSVEDIEKEDKDQDKKRRKKHLAKIKALMKHLPDLVDKYFSDDFKYSWTEYNKVLKAPEFADKDVLKELEDSLIEAFEKVIDKMENEEEYLEDELKLFKKSYPFLFD